MKIQKLKNCNSRTGQSSHCLLFTIAPATPLAAVICSGLELFIADEITV